MLLITTTIALKAIKTQNVQIGRQKLMLNSKLVMLVRGAYIFCPKTAPVSEPCSVQELSQSLLDGGPITVTVDKFGWVDISQEAGANQ